MKRQRRVCWALLAGLGLGCSIAPRDLGGLRDPSPLVRARAAGLGRELPDQVVIPALIDRLEDPDGVVRLAAHEELRLRTGRDFGFVPWADPSERARAVARWRAWGAGRRAGAGRLPTSP